MRYVPALLLLWVSLAHGASTITIPEGPFEYGPFTIDALHKYTEIQLQPVSGTMTSALFFFDMSEDKGKTWMLDVCSGELKPPLQPSPGGDCPVPIGLKPTHFRVRGTMEGGSLTLKGAPTMRSKNK